MRRRSFLAAAGSALAVGNGGCLRPPTGRSAAERPTANGEGTPSGRWSQLGRGPRHARHAPDARGPREGCEIAWEALGDRPVYPPVVDGAVYLTDAWAGGTAFALAPTDGARSWTNGDLPPVRWAPAVDGTRLFVLSRTAENVVRLHALDRKNGDPLWTRAEGLTASLGSRPPIGPTVSDGTVYVAAARGITACRAETGDVRWTATLGPHLVETEDGPTWRTDWAKPAVTDERAFTFDRNESYRATREVYAVDRATGDRAWTAELTVGDGWSLKAHPVVGSDRVFVSALKPDVSAGLDDSPWAGKERLFALDVGSGDVVWDRTLPRKTLTPPAFADGTLYVGEWFPDADTGRLRAIDAADGSVVWTYETDAGAVLSPTVAGDTVYAGQGDEIAAVDRTDGTGRWRLRVGERIGPPVVVGDTAFVQTAPGRDDDSRLLAVREP